MANLAGCTAKDSGNDMITPTAEYFFYVASPVFVKRETTNTINSILVEAVTYTRHSFDNSVYSMMVRKIMLCRMPRYADNMHQHMMLYIVHKNILTVYVVHCT